MKAIFCAIAISLCCALALGQAQYKVLWSFGGAPNDGSGPVSSLVLDSSGNLYGTTYGGGSSSAGTVFELTPGLDGTWTESILYSFCPTGNSCVDGAYPAAGLVFDSAGNLYGTTEGGGAYYECSSGLAGCGTVFELSSPASPGGMWTETVLYSFCAAPGCADGFSPTSQLAIDASGRLYGTTGEGGNGHLPTGTVFELSPAHSGWTESVLYSFCSLGHGYICPDGAMPLAGVTLGGSGNLYGTTKYGGSLQKIGEGSVYKLSPGSNGWTESLVVGSGAGSEGGNPLGSVALDKLGNLYSTFSEGGTNFGGVFRYSLQNGKTTIFSFDGTDGGYPTAGMLLDSKNRALYGTTFIGGANGCGTVFKLASPAQETVLYSFDSQPNYADGCGPLAAVILGKGGNLFGTTKIGGTSTNCQFGCGVVFEVNP